MRKRPQSDKMCPAFTALAGRSRSSPGEVMPKPRICRLELLDPPAFTINPRRNRHMRLAGFHLFTSICLAWGRVSSASVSADGLTQTRKGKPPATSYPAYPVMRKK